MTQQVTAHDRAIADATAFVTFSLYEAINAVPEETLPGLYAYHLFSGFAGFCDHAAAAGLALARALDGNQLILGFIELTDEYAAAVIDHALRTEAPADNLTLRQIADGLVAKYHALEDA